MPTYDYACEACGHTFEEFQSISANPLKKCPECGKLKLKRLIGAGAGFIFKGSGFYETDYRSNEYKEKAKAESSAEKSSDSSSSSSDSSSSKKTESKSESKSSSSSSSSNSSNSKSD